MRMTNLLSAIVAVVVLASGGALSGCSKKSVGTEAAANTLSHDEALSEAQQDGKIAWTIDPDGQVTAQVTTKNNEPIGGDLAGTLTWKGPTSEAKVTMTADPQTGMLTGAGPKLSGDMTEIKYNFTVNGKPWTGAIHVSAGGTKELAEEAKKAQAKNDALKGKKGPNGGVLQVVGDDVVEIVGDKGTGQVRVYELDADLKPIKIGDRKIKLGVVGSTSETLVLTPDPGGLFVFGKLSTKVDPRKITIAITIHDHTDVVLVGWTPGVDVVLFGPPLFVIFVVDLHWGVVVIDEDHHHHWHGHGHGHGRWHEDD